MNRLTALLLNNKSSIYKWQGRFLYGSAILVLTFGVGFWFARHYPAVYPYPGLQVDYQDSMLVWIALTYVFITMLIISALLIVFYAYHESKPGGAADDDEDDVDDSGATEQSNKT